MIQAGGRRDPVRAPRLLRAAAAAAGVAVALAAASCAPATNAADNHLNGVACPSAAQCWAVGQTASVPGGDLIAETRAPLLEHERNGHWQPVPVPTAPGGNEALNAIACPSARQCWAVGGSSYTGPAVVERWAGGGWQLARSPTVRDGELTGISCPSDADCWAVGGTQTPGGVSGAVVEHWDGRRWARWPSPPDGLDPAAIACPAADRCWVVGSGAGGADRLVSGRWIPARLPGSQPTQTVIPGFASVACAGGADCWAVARMLQLSAPGRNSPAVNIVDHWDGRSWRAAAALLPARALAAAAACAGPSCWLLGSGDGPAGRPLVLRWQAGRWVAAPLAGAHGPGDVRGLACARACWAVGGTGELPVSPLTARVAGPG